MPTTCQLNTLASTGCSFAFSAPAPDLELATAPIRALYDPKNGQQSGNPVKGAKLIVEALTKTRRCERRTLPARLAIGKDAVAFENAVLQLRHQELDAWADLALTTDFDEVS